MEQHATKIEKAISEIRSELSNTSYYNINSKSLTSNQLKYFGNAASKYNIKIGNLIAIYFGICNYGTNRKY